MSQNEKDVHVQPSRGSNHPGPSDPTDRAIQPPLSHSFCRLRSSPADLCSHTLRLFSLMTAYKKYLIYPEYSDTFTVWHNCPKIWTTPYYYIVPIDASKSCWAAGKKCKLWSDAAVPRRLIWVFTFCSGLSVRVLVVNTVGTVFLNYEKCGQTTHYHHENMPI